MILPLASTQLWKMAEKSAAAYVLAGGLFLSLILCLLARTQTRARRKIGAAALELEQSQQALSESEERYRTITETASDAIITIDEHSKMLFVNPAAETIFGYKVAEMTNQPLTMLMPDYMRHLHEAGLKRYLTTGHKHLSWDGVEVPGLHKDGHEVPLEISFGEFRRKGYNYFTGVVRDITERKLIEKALAERTRLTALSAEVNMALTQSETLQGSLRLCTEALVKHLDAAFAEARRGAGFGNRLAARAPAVCVAAAIVHQCAHPHEGGVPARAHGLRRLLRLRNHPRFANRPGDWRRGGEGDFGGSANGHAAKLAADAVAELVGGRGRRDRERNYPRAGFHFAAGEPSQ